MTSQSDCVPVYRQYKTGALFRRSSLKEGPDHQHISGKPSVLMVPLTYPVRNSEGIESNYPPAPSAISVGEHEMSLFFEHLPGWSTTAHLPEEQLIKELEIEDLEFNPAALAQKAHTVANTLGDGLPRALLIMMSRGLFRAYTKYDASDTMPQCLQNSPPSGP